MEGKEKNKEKVKVDEKGEKEEKGSNSCVMDLSIEGGGEEKENANKEEGNTNILNKSFDDILNFTQKLILKDNFENILDLDENGIIISDENKTRSKTFFIKNTNINNSKI